MGSQQLLLLMVVFFVISIAIAIGFRLYNQIADNHYRRLCIDELNYFKSKAEAYYLHSHIIGGSSHGMYDWDAASIAHYIGVGHDGGSSLESELATYEVSLDDVTVTFLADPKEEGVDNIQLSYNLDTKNTTITYP